MLMNVLKIQSFWYSFAFFLYFEKAILVPKYLIVQFT